VSEIPANMGRLVSLKSLRLHGPFSRAQVPGAPEPAHALTDTHAHTHTRKKKATVARLRSRGLPWFLHGEVPLSSNGTDENCLHSSFFSVFFVF
jgi:hypothetical protein